MEILPSILGVNRAYFLSINSYLEYVLSEFIIFPIRNPLLELVIDIAIPNSIL